MTTPKTTLWLRENTQRRTNQKETLPHAYDSDLIGESVIVVVIHYKMEKCSVLAGQKLV